MAPGPPVATALATEFPWLMPAVIGVAIGLALAAAAVLGWNQWQRLRAADPVTVVAPRSAPAVPPAPAAVAPPAPDIVAAPAATADAPQSLPPAAAAPPTVAPVPPPPAALLPAPSGSMAQSAAPPPVKAPPAVRSKPRPKPAQARQLRPVQPRARPADAPRRVAAGARPSFDCRRSGSDVSRAICADAGLARLDRDMAAAYARAVARRPDAARRLDQRQSDFLNARQRCESDGCIARLTRRRLRELSR